MRTKRMNRSLCFWNFASLLGLRQRLNGNTPMHKSGGLRHTLSRLAPNFPYRRGLLALSLLLPATTALAGPAGEQVTAGSAAITRPNAVTTQITQQSQKAVIDWQNFSIGQQEMVRFQQPGTDSVALNRVLGNDPSRIYGSLSANGQVFLVNPSGILFSPTSQVSVHGLLSTTHNISNTDFMAGRYSFSRTGNGLPEAQVINQGYLQASDGGYIVLAGDYTANSGVIQASMGKVALASGNRFTVDLDGDQLISLAVDEASLARHAGVENFGTLAADGGQVVMTAKVANELATTVVNNAGLVQARSIEERNGEIILQGGSYGIVANSGTMDASGYNAKETGGSVKMLGEKVGLLDHGVVDASGANGGGTALIGGDYQGKNPEIQNAKTTYQGKDAVVKADATDNGDGGRVVLWSDDVTHAYGSISARGGANGGDGGFVEVSGKGYLDFLGTVDTRAPLGQTGTLLLDPTDITIQATNPDINGDTTTGDDIALVTDLDNSANYGTVTSIITNSALSGLLTTTNNVTLAATNNITVNDPVNWSSAYGLTLNADFNVNVNADITNGSTGGIFLNSTGGDINIAASKVVSTSGTVQSTSAGSFSSGTGSAITGNTVSIATTAGGYLTIGGAVTSSPGGSITLETAGTYDITTTATGLVTSNTITLQPNGTTGPIGASGNPLHTSSIGGSGNAAINIGFNTTGPNAVYLAHTGDATLESVFTTGAGTPVNISASNNLTTPNISTGTSDLILSAGNLLTIPTLITLAGANIEMHTNRLSIDTSGSPGTVDAGTGLTWITPYTNGWDVDLGSTVENTVNTLELSTNELNRISAGTLRIGSTTAGTLNISAAIAPSGTSTLSLESGGTVTQAGAGTISATNLAIKALGDVTLNTVANTVTNLAAGIGDATHTNKNFSFKNGALNIGVGIDGLNGISIYTAGTYDPGAPDGVLSLISSGALTQSANAFLGNKAVYAEGTKVALTQNNNTGVIAGKATGASTGDTFAFTSANGVHLSTVNGFAGVQQTNSGLPDQYAVILTGPSISQDVGATTGAPVSTPTGTGLEVVTTGTVDLSDGNNSVSLLKITGTLNGGLNFQDKAALDFSGVTTTNQPVWLSMIGADLTVSGVINAGSGSQAQIGLKGANITTSANISGEEVWLSSAPSGGITIANATVAGNTEVDLETDTLSLTGTGKASSPTGDIHIAPMTTDRSITIGQATCAVAPCLLIPDASMTKFNSLKLGFGNDTIGVATDPGYPFPVSGDIYLGVTTALDRTTSGWLGLFTGGEISQSSSAPAITALNLGISAVTGPVILGGDVNAHNVTNVAAKTGGAFSLDVAGSLTVTSLSGGDPVITVNGITAPGGVTLRATDDLTLAQPINAGTGQVSLYSGNGAIVDGNGIGVNNVTASTLDISAYSNIELDAQVSSYTATSSSGTVTVRPYPPPSSSPPPPLLPPPTLDACTADPTLAGCTTVLPTLDACITDPTASGCTAVLPTLDTCLTTPTAPGCTAVLPTLATCTVTPTAPGCTAVLPALADCTVNPTLPGCTAVLPSLATCTVTPTAPGCTAVLPALADCTVNPTLPGCTAVLPALATCIVTPSAPGCATVLPPLDTCLTNPTAPGCTAVLPPVLVETPTTEVVATIQAVVTMGALIPTQGFTATFPSTGQQGAPGTTGGSVGSEEEKLKAQQATAGGISQEIPLAKQPIFDLNGGGIAGQNMVCK